MAKDVGGDNRRVECTEPASSLSQRLSLESLHHAVSDAVLMHRQKTLIDRAETVIAPEVQPLLASPASVPLEGIHRLMGGKERIARNDWTTCYQDIHWHPVIESDRLTIRSITAMSKPIAPEIQHAAQQFLHDAAYASRYEREPGLVQVAYDAHTGTIPIMRSVGTAGTGVESGA